MAREDLTLPEDLRPALRKPFGDVLTGEALADRIRSLNPGKVVAVGDYVYRSLVELSVTPDVAILDGRVMRTQVGYPELGDRTIFRVKNPKGMITREAWKAVVEALNTPGRTAVLVDGEEDLLAIPAVIHAPDGSVVVYGQPGEGAVVMVVDEGLRSEALKVVGRMREHGG